MEWVSTVAISGAEEQLMIVLGQIKASKVLVRLLDISMAICLIMSVMLFVERVYMAIVIAIVKISGRKPGTRYKWEPLQEDLEQGNLAFPMILVYQLSIGAACCLSWPSDRLIIQVLDDSTDPAIKTMVETECQIWASKGVNIKYEIRDNRNGYKAGALKEGLKRSYVKECDHVAIFDADFQPEPDFLHRTIPFLVHNPQIGLVQARWKFGTAGVWRMAAIEEAGGWKDRTTVEDMDLAIRASLKGWKFVYVGTLQIIAHIVTFVFYCVVLPAAVLVPDYHIPKWGAVYIPTIITILNAISTPRSIHLVVFWIVFENVMALHRTKGTFIGLMEVGRVNEWIVTEKLGDALKIKPVDDALKVKPAATTLQRRFNFIDRLNLLELGFGCYLLFCGCYDLIYGKYHFFIYLLLQAIAFFVMGFGYVGTFVPSSSN
ncbi:hypothetical protein SASPL_111731 [Salvia splendens]|uniref:Glycosyltransferase 2-like domain-containing protein n=1 Tax=Salvia splendens TaxID=180675 RepID=A0A8X8YD07_SALSN|nr:hypothetical protein SASPL_111731 [Salvia splendens]